MKIAFVHPKINVKGGAENIVIWLSNVLVRRGHQVAIFTEQLNKTHWEQHFFENIDFHIFPKTKLERFINSNHIRSFKHSRQLSQIVHDFDVVVGHLYPSYWWITKARERLNGKWKTVWLCEEPHRKIYSHITDSHFLNYVDHMPHDFDNEHMKEEVEYRLNTGFIESSRRNFKAKVDRAIVLKFDIVLANSHFTASNIRTIYGIEPEVCHLGIPITPESDYCRGTYVGVLTTLSVKKNVHNTIRAIHELVYNRSVKDLQLKIGGKGPKRQELEKLVEDLNLTQHVEFIGDMPDSELFNFYRNSQAVVYCPIDEPFGLVPVEAMAAKTPLVVSNHGGPAEIIEDNKTGLLVNPFDPKAIADGINILWNNDKIAQLFGCAGRVKAEKYFSLDAFADRFISAVSK